MPVMCWTINFGCSLNDNEFLYFLAPQLIANYWMGLDKVSPNQWHAEKMRNCRLKVINCIQQQNRHPDRRVMWLKKLFLQLYSEQERAANGGSGGAQENSNGNLVVMPSPNAFISGLNISTGNEFSSSIVYPSNFKRLLPRRLSLLPPPAMNRRPLPPFARHSHFRAALGPVQWMRSRHLVVASRSGKAWASIQTMRHIHRMADRRTRPHRRKAAADQRADYAK